MYSSGRIGKSSLIVLIIIMVFINFFGLVLLPKTVRAQATEVFGGPVKVTGEVAVIADIPANKKEVKETMAAQLLGSALGALVHGFSYFMRKLAYDAAMYAAHGGKGQGALVFKQGFGAYLETVALDSAADAIGALGEPFGLNLCQPPDLNFQLFLQIGLRGIYFGTEGPKPNCTWQDLKGSWGNIEEKYFGENGQLSPERMFSNALRFENTDFGIALGAVERVDRIQSQQVVGAQAEREEGEGFKALTDIITGNVKEPGQVIKEETFAATNKHQSTLTATQVAGIYGSGALQVIPLAGSVFLNTFLTEGIKELQQQFLSLFDDSGGGGGDDIQDAMSFESAGFQLSLKKAKEVFSSFLAVTIEQRENYDLLSEFTTCPDAAPTIPGLNNCVMDDSLREAVRRADTGQPMTIREAMKEGLLHPNWILASPRRVVDNTSYGCYKNAYCYSNIQKLRRSRILPLGFEIAALLADPDHPQEKWTLEYVVNHFDDCKTVKDANGNNVIEPDASNFPYCHLIDPNWIIKAPDSRCNGLVYSSNLTDQSSGLRAQECVDIQTRIKETQGLNRSQTNDFFGYCAREKKVWRLPGEACESYYNTCTTYTSGDGAFVSYLAKTVDYGECNFDSVGCLAYSTEKDGDKWVASINAEGENYKEQGRNQALYFNERIKNYTCSASDNGCSGFYLGTLKSGTTDEYINNYDKPAFIKKAPDYLGCYDINKSQNSPEINWPQTKPELGQVSQDEKCKDFAQVCLPEEVGCDSYTAKKGPSSTPIPGIAGEGDKCDASCVGYDTFKQNATEFAPSEFPLYFIPQEGKSCPAQYAGCDEFTNIDELAKGGEGLEYYTDIKYCELPNDKNQKVFYSWYGSMSEGYVLKLHKLRPVTEKDNIYISNLVGLSGEAKTELSQIDSPSYATDNPLELTELYTSCNAGGYNKLINGGMPGVDGTASLDCRALYDKDGKVYYRILDNTITVSDECHPLRKTTAYFYDDAALTTQLTCEERGGYWNTSLNPNKCQRCTNGGIYKDGACVYWAIAKAGESDSCSGPSNNKGAYNGCREYVGNEGNDTKIVLNLDFEPTNNDLNKAKAGWWPPTNELQVVSESVQVGLHSLQVKTAGATYLIASSTLEKDGWYKLSFWARGKSASLQAYFLQGSGQNAEVTGSFTLADSQLSIGDEWKEYKLGPIQFTGDALQDTNLTFKTTAQSGGVLYFIDNIELRYAPDTYPIIKDSWKTKFPYNGESVNADVPLVCDSNPTDPFPGDALGCRAYSEESTGNTVNVTGFEKLCRVEAVGCRAVFDSYNTKETGAIAFNAWCQGVLGDDSCELTLDSEKSECKIEQGKDGCYVDKIKIPDSMSLTDAQITESTIIIPADTPVDKPVYLTVRPEFSCLEKAQGCQEVGAEEQTLPDKDSSASYEHNATYLINDPAQYVGANRTLCRNDLVGCEAFKAASDIFYFKNPVKTGNSFCEYKAKVENNGVEYKGWFLKDVGACYTSATPNAPSVKTGKICNADSDCDSGETCQDKGKVSCYSDYLQAGGFYDIWSNETPQYKGNVGVCPSEKNGCRELVDPADISQIHPEGEPYYTIFDNRVTGKAGECEGKASQVEGCVLFNKTDEPNLLYDSVQTYKNSEDKNFAPVSLVTNTNNKDSNLLLKVIRDRQCAEWLACQGSLPVPDTQSGTGERYSCYALQPCAEGSNLECETPSTLTDEGDSRLLYGEYITRDVSWSGAREYSGYSLFEKTPPANLEFITVKKDVTKLEQDAIFMGYINKKAASVCSTPAGSPDDGKKCGSKGICYDKKCIVSPDDSYPAELLSDQATAKANFYKYLYKVECRGYPEQNSPFKGNLDEVSQFTQSFLSNASFCAEGENCDCNYIKVEYSEANETKYYELGGEPHSDLQKGGICQDGKYDGESCSSNKDCADKDDENNNGTCIRQSKRNTRIGWNGYCMERDLSRHINGRIDDALDAFACLTWLPLDYVPGLFDIYYSDPSVGYVPPSGAGNPGQAYCTEMLGVGGLSPELEFDCDLTKSWSGQDFYGLEAKLGGNLCKVDNMILPSSLSWSDVQENTWEMIKELSGSLNGFINDLPVNKMMEQTYNYIGRVDTSVLPVTVYLDEATKQSSNFLWGRPGGKWDDGYGYAGGNLGSLVTENSITYAILGSTGGFNPNNLNAIVPYAPLFPDVENNYSQSAVEKFNPNNFNFETPAELQHDSGIIRQGPNKAETLLTKDMIYAVSFVPLWLTDNWPNSDTVDDPVVPAMGIPMTIYLDKEYPTALGESANLDMKKSAALGNCSFCKYWTMKTEHKEDELNNNEAVEGYLLQWMAMDPTYGEDPVLGDASAIEEYMNANTYLVNPLENANGKADVRCGSGAEDDNHFIAVEILFDELTGKFIGYRSRNCEELDEDGVDEFGYAMAVIFTLKPMCVEAVKVVGDDGIKNKAYTDRVWSNYKENILPVPDAHNFTDNNTDASPYGSARFNSLDNCDKDSDNAWCYLYRAPLSNSVHGGTPWQCLSHFQSAGNVGFSGKCTLEEGWQGYNRAKEIETKGDLAGEPFFVADTKKYLLFDSLFATLYGKSSRVAGDKAEVSKGSWSNQLIAQGNKLYKFTGDKTYSYNYEPWTGNGSPIKFNDYPYVASYWVSPQVFMSYVSNQPTPPNPQVDPSIVLFGDHAAFRGTPPKIYPAIDCAGNKCELDKSSEGFAINGISGNKADDSLFGTKVKMAQVQFFAWADHNQMPLRRIMVDWREKGVGGDGNTISGTSEGYYTNYKPYCGDDSGKAKECVKLSGATIATGSGITCQSNDECPTATKTCSDVGPKFGNQPNKTCKDSPVIRIFNYTCDADQNPTANYVETVSDMKNIENKTLPSSTEKKYKNLTIGLGQKWYNFLKDKNFDDDDKVCVYQPRVQVLDNWGWCTGECTVPGTNGNTSWPQGGCYHDSVVTGAGLVEAVQCKESNDAAWKAFDNIVVVAPGN